MRALLVCVLMLAAGIASADTLATCQSQKQTEAGVQLCVETARLHSTNQLRKLSAATRAAVRTKAQSGENQGLLRDYRLLEARHVRERNSLCRKQTMPLERDACIADMNEAHGAQLARLVQ